MKHYILNKDKTIKEVDLLEWAKWFEKDDRFLFKSTITNYRISTVFIGIGHRIGFEEDNSKDPVLFETMIFKDGEEIYCERYTNYKDAEKGHLKAFAEIGKKEKVL